MTDVYIAPGGRVDADEAVGRVRTITLTLGDDVRGGQVEVHVDRDDNGAIVGIELLNVEAVTVNGYDVIADYPNAVPRIAAEKRRLPS